MKTVVELTARAVENRVEPLIYGIFEAYVINDNTEESVPEVTDSAEATECTENPDEAPGESPGPETELPTMEATEMFTQFHPFTEPATEKPAINEEPTENGGSHIGGKDSINPATQAPEKEIDETKFNSASALAKKPKLNIKTATLKCGKTINLNVKNKGSKKISFTSNNKKTAKVNKKGIVTALRKGRAKITAKLGNKMLYCIVKVVTNPRLSKSEIEVKKGKTVTVSIIGRAKSVKNKYKSTDYAKIIAKKKADKIKIRGLKKGKTNLKIKVNGLVLELKVKVI